MTSGIGTYATFEKNIKNMNTAQTNMEKLQVKVSSGTAFNDFSDVVESVPIEIYLGLKSQITSVQNTIKTNQIALNNAYTVHDSFDTIIGIAQQTMVQLTSRISITGPTQGIGTQVKNSLASIESALNITDPNGNFLFSGSNTNIQPVNNLATVSNLINGQPTANYYSGDNVIANVQASDQLNVSYGVIASDPSLQEFIGALNTILTADASNDIKGLQSASATLNTAIKDLVQRRAVLDNNIKTIEDTTNQQKLLAVKLTNTVTNMEETNIPATVTEIEKDRAQVIGSYKVLTTLQRLSLTEYLR